VCAPGRSWATYLELGTAAGNAVDSRQVTERSERALEIRRVTHQALGAYLERTFLRLGDGGVSSSPRAAGDRWAFIGVWSGGDGGKQMVVALAMSYGKSKLASEQRSG
jgi:hypothetical protein